MNVEIILRNKITSNHPIDRVVMQQLIWAYSHTETTLTMTDYCNNELQRIGHKKVVKIVSIPRNTKGQFSTSNQTTRDGIIQRCKCGSTKYTIEVIPNSGEETIPICDNCHAVFEHHQLRKESLKQYAWGKMEEEGFSPMLISYGIEHSYLELTADKIYAHVDEDDHDMIRDMLIVLENLEEKYAKYCKNVNQLRKLRNAQGRFSTTNPKPNLMRVSDQEKRYLELSRMSNEEFEEVSKMTHQEMQNQLRKCWACPTNNYESCRQCPDTFM